MESNKRVITQIKESPITENVSNPNKDRDLIFTAIEISKRSKVPILFMSGPGMGKTTTVNLYGKVNGYHVETIIGSHYSQDEILGYQVNNNKSYLEVLEPQWYHNIMECSEKRIPSILFLDEISMTSENVQSALLQLCFERKIRGNNYLPEDCIVVSAANYKNNLPGYANVITPQLNRFCIINLLPGNHNGSIQSMGMSLVDEVFQDLYEVEDNLPTFRTDYSLSSEAVKGLVSDLKNNFSKLFTMYSDKHDSSLGYLDIRNMDLDGLYDGVINSMPEVYNFISKRTLSYYGRVLKAICEMGLTADNPVVLKCIEGLVGIGTNNWNYEDEDAALAQIAQYHETLLSQASVLISVYSNIESVQSELDTSENVFTDDSLHGKIQHFLWDMESNTSYNTQELDKIIKDIHSKYSITNKVEDLESVLNNPINFRNDMESIMLLSKRLSSKKSDEPSLEVIISALDQLYNSYNFYYGTSVLAIDEASISA